MTQDTESPIHTALEAFDTVTLERLAAFSEGTLSESAQNELMAQAKTDPHVAQALEHLRPLTAEQRGAMAAAALKNLRTPASTPAPVIPLPVLRRSVIVGLAAAAAAAAWYFFPKPAPSVPPYTLAGLPAHAVSPAQTLRLVLTPQDKTPASVRVQLWLRRGQDIFAVPDHLIEQDAQHRFTVNASVHALTEGRVGSMQLYAQILEAQASEDVNGFRQRLAASRLSPEVSWISSRLVVRPSKYAYVAELSQLSQSSDRAGAPQSTSAILVPNRSDVLYTAAFLPDDKVPDTLHVLAFTEFKEGQRRQVQRPPTFDRGRIQVTLSRDDLVGGLRLGLVVSPETLPSLDRLTLLEKQGKLPDTLRLQFTPIQPSNP